MGKTEPIVYVIDDDEALCQSIQMLLEAARLTARSFLVPEDFLKEYERGQPGCLVLDVRLRGTDGLDFQKRLVAEGIRLPVIMMTGHGDIPMAVRAVKNGAFDFLEKPVHDQLLIQRVRDALELDAANHAGHRHADEIAARLARLTPREREVMDLVVAGRANKQIAAQLQVTEKTVEVHRKRVMHKMGVRSAVALARLMINGRAAPPRR